MSARILVVDDNRANLDLMLYLLRAFGHRPTAAGDGTAALDALREDAYDLVLCDVLMPGIDGFEFARRVRADRGLENVRLIAVTALAMAGDRDRVLAAGFDGYIPKPIEPETFVLRVDAFLPPELRSIAGAGMGAESLARQSPDDAAGPVVLAVDDLQVNLDAISGALRPFGFTVVEATNMAEAYARAKETHPSIILCDVHMNQGDGFDFIEKIKADPELRDVPFLFVTSTASSMSDRKLELEEEKFIQRAIDPAMLLEEVERALQEPADGDD